MQKVLIANSHQQFRLVTRRWCDLKSTTAGSYMHIRTTKFKLTFKTSIFILFMSCFHSN